MTKHLGLLFIIPRGINRGLVSSQVKSIFPPLPFLLLPFYGFFAHGKAGDCLSTADKQEASVSGQSAPASCSRGFNSY
jgi:hypothetical protein